jgi:hypothetical protein
MTGRIFRLPGMRGEVPELAGKSRNLRGQDKKRDVWDHTRAVVALFYKALRRSAAMCGPNPAMCTLRRLPLPMRPRRTSRCLWP